MNSLKKKVTLTFRFAHLGKNSKKHISSQYTEIIIQCDHERFIQQGSTVSVIANNLLFSKPLWDKGSVSTWSPALSFSLRLMNHIVGT